MKVKARVQRSGDWWAIGVPEVPGVFTQAKRLDQVSEVVADAVATMVDGVSVEDVEVELVPDLPAEVGEMVADSVAKAAAAREATDEASRAMRTAVHLLRHNEHLTTRDTARLLGITHQRVSQLENSRLIGIQ